MFIERTIHETASRPTPEATEALRYVIDGPALTYAHVARHALALQRKARRDFEYAALDVADLHTVMTDELPENIDDMRAYLADHLDTLQERMHASSTDMWEAYWTEEGPQGEDYCRNRRVDHLPDAIRLVPERRVATARAGLASPHGRRRSTRHGTRRRVDGSGRDVWQRVEEPRRRTWGRDDER